MPIRSQFLRVKLKGYDGEWSRMEFLPYAIWHNQKTGKITIHTEAGYKSFPADAIETIDLMQTCLPFESASAA